MKYKYHPHNINELSSFVNNEISIQGLGADLNCINTSLITNISSLFFKSQFNGDISKWNTSNIKNMSNIFAYSKFNGNISEWDVSNVINMNGMFLLSAFRDDIYSWDLNNLNDVSVEYINQWKANHMYIYESRLLKTDLNIDKIIDKKSNIKL